MPGLFYSGFTIWRAGRVSDGQGGWTETFADTGQTVAGRITPLGGGEQFRADQKVGVITHRFSCDASVDVLPGDQVRYSGETYRVDSAPKTSQRTRKECSVEFVQTGTSG